MLRRGFSLIELLVALSILAVVAAIVVPRLLNIQDQANDVVAKQNAAMLQSALDQWMAMGGTFTKADGVHGDGTEIMASFIMLMSAPNGVNNISCGFTSSNPAMGVVTAKDSIHSGMLRLSNISIFPYGWCPPQSSWPDRQYLNPNPPADWTTSTAGMFWTDGDVVLSFRGDGSHDVYTVKEEGPINAGGPIPSTLTVYPVHFTGPDIWEGRTN